MSTRHIHFLLLTVPVNCALKYCYCLLDCVTVEARMRHENCLLIGNLPYCCSIRNLQLNSKIQNFLKNFFFVIETMSDYLSQ